jgi:hypothetical protein
MANYRAISSGNFSNLAIWQDDSLGYFFTSSILPGSSDNVFTNNFTVNINTSFEVSSLRNTTFIPPTNLALMSIPQMSSNTTPSGTAAASSVNTVSTSAWNAFDRNSATIWQSANVAGQWLSYQFPTGRIIKRYGFSTFNNSLQLPRTWTFEGSNNGSTWAVLDTQTNFSTAISTFYSFDISANITSYTYYRINVSAVQGGGSNATTIAELEMSEVTNLYGGTVAGGSFIFNSGSISGSVTSTTQGLFAGATNLVQVTATTGSVTLNLSSNATAAVAGNLILHSGNCNFDLNGFNFTGGIVNAVCINKTSAGTININGNILASTAATAGGFTSNNGNTVVVGNVTGGSGATGITQTAGNITIIGNVTGGAGTVGLSLTGASSQLTVVGNVTGGTLNTNGLGISFTGTSGNITGNVTGGTAAIGLSTSGVITITGNVTGNTGAGIATSNTVNVTGNVTAGGNGSGVGVSSTTTNLTVNVTGTVTATSTAVGVSTGGGTGNQVVNLSGNMINVGGRQAIYSQNLFIDNTTTTQWRLFTPGSQNKTLYSADTFPNLPSSTNVRSGSVYGVLNTLSGSMVVPSPSDVRINVPVDNTVGTGTSLTAADFLNEISSSSDAVAQRLRNIATDDTVGSLLTGFNNGGF